MLVGLMADTHDDLQTVKAAFEIFIQAKASLVLHAGDWIKPDSVTEIETLARTKRMLVKGVLGNNDVELRTILENVPNFLTSLSLERRSVLTTEFEGRSIGVYHGDDTLVLEGIVALNTFDVILTGHTHRQEITTISNTLLINPGPCSKKVARFSRGKDSVALYNPEYHMATFHEL